MRPGHLSTAPPRLLLIASEAYLAATVRQAAAALNAGIDQVSDISAAISHLLGAHRHYTHILFSGDPTPDEIETLSGLAGETGDHPVLLLRLGDARAAQASQQQDVHHLPLTSPADLAGAIGSLAAPAASPPPVTPAGLAALIHEGGLRMRFQPILRCSDLEPVGLEALARLARDGQRLLQPRDFLPLAIFQGQERLLMAVAVSRIVIAVRAGQLTGHLSIAVNLTLAALMDEPVIARSLDFCAIAGVQPERIIIEALETETPPDFARLARGMEAWRKAGFRLAMDDAGPGLPHWREMMALPFDTVKLDAALIANPALHGLAARIADSARRHGHQIIAEGVEDEAGLTRARAIGVDAVQGFHFARPLPAPAVIPWLQRWTDLRDTSATTKIRAVGE